MFLLLACLPASADSNNNFSNATLNGVSNTTVAGTFSFNSSTDQFSNISISFSGNSVFGGIKVSDPNSVKGIWKQGKGWMFSWLTLVKGDLVLYSVLFNPVTGQFTAGGGISNWQNQGNFNYMSVPEGGAIMSYLLLSGLAVFGGIFLSGRQRRVARVARSS